VKLILFVASGIIAALAGILYAARLGSVRGDMAQGFELDIITIVLLGGVSIFGGSGNLVGVGLSIFVILNLRNGMGLANITGILPFDQAHQGALEAEKELKNSAALQFLGPTPENSVAGQIEIVTNAATQGVGAIMISNNSGDQIVPSAKAAHDKGIKVVTWDS